MILTHFIIITFTTAGLLFAHGCSSLPELATMAETDANLAEDVYSRLGEDSFVPGVNIGVRAKDGVITLSGLPQNSEQRARVISIAAGTPGVDQATNSYY